MVFVYVRVIKGYYCATIPSYCTVHEQYSTVDGDSRLRRRGRFEITHNV